MRPLLNLFRTSLTDLPVVLVTTTALLGGSMLAANAAAAASDAKLSQASRYWQSPEAPDREAYVDEPMPPGFQVIPTELEGPVFADAQGRTLYKWQLQALRNGATGDREGKASACTSEVLRVSAGLMSPYPAGLVLPDLDLRRSCTDTWPPVLAPKDAKEVGKWTIIPREDGAGQWAYGGYPLYTSILDKKAGDVLGGTKMGGGGDGGVVRVPVGPTPVLPPEFEVVPMVVGRMLVDNRGYSVYYWDGDAPNVSKCQRDCLADWTPVPAPAVAKERQEWTIIERSPGIKQWAFRGKPLYTYNHDQERRAFWGADVPGWHNAYTQRVVTPPEEFTIQDAEGGGQVLATANGRTIYRYSCRDDSFAQLACDNPDTTQAYRMAICGSGDPKVCLETFPYVIAPAGAKSASRLWSVMAIDPNTGHRAAPGQQDALQVWAYRDRPVYTYAGDDQPGVTNGDGLGEFTGRRNGYKAFVLLDIFQGNEFRP